MQTVRLYITETLSYEREVVVTIPDGMSEMEMNRAIEVAERGATTIDEMLMNLNRKGIEQFGPYDDDMRSPDDSNVECNEYDFIYPSADQTA